VIGSVFGSAHKFLHSTPWFAVEVASLSFVGLLFCATVFWVFKDARRRIGEPVLVAAATLLGAIPPFFGPLIYMLFRPPEYLEDVRERELEIRAIETRLGGPELRCGVCGSAVEADYLVCPVWQICPYCETPVGVEAPVALAKGPRAPRSTGTRSSG
jgi:hypothetical protein